jgi:hypothetical protein
VVLFLLLELPFYIFVSSTSSTSWEESDAEWEESDEE